MELPYLQIGARRGRLEARLLHSGGASNGTRLAAGNGSRVRIILTGVSWETPTVGSAFGIGDEARDAQTPFLTVTPYRPHAVATIEDYGDLITRELYAQISDVENDVIWEVLWHPDDI